MEIHILTLFPEMITHAVSQSVLGRAQKAGVFSVQAHNLRDWTQDAHRTTDDRPFGGGQGMIMMIEPIDRALNSLGAKKGTPQQKIILTSAKGTLYSQQVAQAWISFSKLFIICGHYEGVDERVAQYLVDEEVRIGNYVLTGGELPALVMVDSVARLLPNALGNEQSAIEESFMREGYLEYPQYTRPSEYNGLSVPEVLTQGNHKDITDWKNQHAQQLLEEK
ncbi:MAG: tRNA (guanine-N(1)-)-methyltransferase [Microgenomates group bacterium GW2011_GWF2_45_18]|nr:MAG: tRNA (guanine-N(1)-)-methyltransferase [Microgenomates group bacterium GW2011_GWF1_44_10]KKU02264.1 MAG: tRNA (guanine-N(1)-)-methyltransferase [Microgenomates group bacterium GW2011_GWF2_45_18]OGJ41244.1 MAG: tRNA (guanosine(37)-N1)-methyltransferase TrmD [Candidatus Pacebacteria bacterium RIFOXYB1_FULL_44_10]HAU99271.1 tRNA (guanosine(37)-N1)-methyltransferase TrmD [Candidatus Paceibacterota bacterium]HAX01802.1 tRNA (guanosine(37)-N1)-methyltransferase TrmD [Candidatus Paceibacterota